MSNFLDPATLNHIPLMIGGLRVSPAMTDHKLMLERDEVEFVGAERGAKCIVKTTTKADFNVSAALFSELESRIFEAIARDRTGVIQLLDEGNVGGSARFERARVMSHEAGGSVNTIPTTPISGRFVGPWINGTTLYNAIGTSGVIAAADGQAVELWPLGAGEELLCWLWVGLPEGAELTDPATDWELTARVESAVDDQFSTPQTVATFATIDTPGVVEVKVDGDAAANSDTWYRVSFTGVTGTTPANPTFHPICVIGKRTKA